MRDTKSVLATRRYWITEAGRYALQCAEQCHCDPHMVGLIFACAECGTVYGSMRDQWRASYTRRDKR